MREEFKPWKNVQVIGPPEDMKMDFTNFNRYVFSLKPDNFEPPLMSEEEVLI